MNLELKAKELRRSIFKTICNGGGGHLPASFSIVDIMTVLYYDVLNIDPQRLLDADRDRFILSKGHGGVTLYSILADKGFFDSKHLETYGKKGTLLGGHPDMYKIPGVEASTGALGHGFPFGVGIALAGKMDKKKYRVFVVLGDGECQEGTIWEAALFAAQQRLDTLVAIIDYNKFQAMDRLEKIVGLEPLADKWRSFGWGVKEIDGHNIKDLQALFHSLPLEPHKPNVIVAHTVKGKGISYMENVAIWHYRFPKDDEMQTACRELGLTFSQGKVV